MSILIILASLPLNFYLSILGMIFGIYFITINPLIFNYWIIPKIEKQYNKKIKIKEEDYLMSYYPFIYWGRPQLDISIFLFLKYFKYTKKNIHPNTYAYKLREINYEASNASTIEIILSFITIIGFSYIIIIGIFFILYKKL